jgi:hypothetical protein
MLNSEFDRMLGAMLTSDQPTSITLTELPSAADDLTRLLESAIARGNLLRNRLTRIHLPMRCFPDMGASFWHVPVEDTGKAYIMRLFFQP